MQELLWNKMIYKEECIKIIKPSKKIFQIIKKYKKIIKDALPSSKITLIGSFAIPMYGKEEIDLLVETDNVKKAQEIIQEKGLGRFGIGPIVDGEGYCRSKKRYGIICELHIVPKGHKKIKKYLWDLKYLLTNFRVWLLIPLNWRNFQTFCGVIKI